MTMRLTLLSCVLLLGAANAVKKPDDAVAKGLTKIQRIDEGLTALAKGGHAPEGTEKLRTDLEKVLADSKKKDESSAALLKEVNGALDEVTQFQQSLGKRQASLRKTSADEEAKFTSSLDAQVDHLGAIDKSLSKLAASPLAPEGIKEMVDKVELVMADAPKLQKKAATDPAARKQLATELDNVMAELRSFQVTLAKAQADAESGMIGKAAKGYGGVDGAEERLFDKLMDMQDAPVATQLNVVKEKQYASLPAAKKLLAKPHNNDEVPLAEQFGKLMDKKAEEPAAKSVVPAPTEEDLKKLSAEISKTSGLPEKVTSQLAPVLASLNGRIVRVEERVQRAEKAQMDKDADFLAEEAERKDGEKKKKDEKKKTGIDAQQLLRHEMLEAKHRARKEVAGAKAELQALTKCTGSLKKGDVKGLKAAMAELQSMGGEGANAGFLVLLQNLDM